LTGISIIDRVKDEFDAGRDAEFLEDVEEIFLDGVLAKVEFAGNLAVAQAFGDQRHYLFLAWRLMWEMWRLGRGAIPSGEKDGFLDPQFHRLWPILLAVYWVNAAMVVMSYQFVNAILFTMAGMLAAQRRRAEASRSC
jgi:hypothetical protein